MLLNIIPKPCVPAFLISLAFISCTDHKTTVAAAFVAELNLKRGAVVSCGPADQQLGIVYFPVSCGESVQDEFNLALQLLHSFEYDESEKVFAGIIDRQPDCAMAYWGVAMSTFHPLWTPPSVPELQKGARAIQLAAQLDSKPMEADFIAAAAAFYHDWETKDHRTRCLAFESAMEKLHVKYPGEPEAAILYALALNAAADPSDKTFTKQKKAGSLLQALESRLPGHPGIVHYLIHTYDVPELADQALPAARKYASLAPSSAHALHMPSHIFTRLGIWEECIQSNRASVASAQCYAEATRIKGHWDEELHGLDYLVYAYLQQGNMKEAKKVVDQLLSIQEVSPVNFKVAYAIAAIPARYALENKNWEAAARLEPHYKNFPWEHYPWQKAIIHFARIMGATDIGDNESAKIDLKELYRLHQQLLGEKDSYKANQVQIQILAGEACITLNEGKGSEALQKMQSAVDLEDKTEKHPVTPGEVIPARELLGEMQLALNQPDKALASFELNLKKHPNRFNSLYGAGMAAAKSGISEKAEIYFRQLLAVADSSDRIEINKVKSWLSSHKMQLRNH